MVDYPSDLPGPTTEDYQITLNSGVAQYRSDSGLVTSRRISVENTEDIRISWVFTRTQYPEFVRWYRLTIMSGVLPFNMLVFGSLGTRVHSCRFLSNPSVVYFGRSLSVQVSAMLLITVPISELGDFLIDFALLQAIGAINPDSTENIQVICDFIQASNDMDALANAADPNCYLRG